MRLLKSGPARLTLGLGALLLAGCSALPTAEAPPPIIAEEEPPARIILATTDLAVGVNRLAFALIDPETGPISIPEFEVEAYRLASEELKTEPSRQKLLATFHPWPTGVLGLYTIDVEFDQVGEWAIEVEVTDSEGNARRVGTALAVAEESLSVPLGERPPASQNRTVADVDDLADLTTASPPDPDLYVMTIAEALDAGRPAIIVFATPAFCVSALCGPQVGIVQGLKDLFHDVASFIHIELYANPVELQTGDLTVAEPNPALLEWGLFTEPWTFVLDADGRVASKFEGFVTREELEAALQLLL